MHEEYTVYPEKKLGKTENIKQGDIKYAFHILQQEASAEKWIQITYNIFCLLETLTKENTQPSAPLVDTRKFHWEQSCRHSQQLWLLRNHCCKQQRGDNSPQDTSVTTGDRNTVRDYSHSRCQVPNGSQEKPKIIPSAGLWLVQGGKTEQEYMVI